ncbi:MAG: hypothetical protein LC802_19275 [Acidobacteria bacterium]|nr:hypothetical protein [Acidobacteriota bacterium]
MNCQNFEIALDDLARGALMDAGSREAALAHRDSCHACAARLADESALRAGLRSLAAKTEGAQAPARVESALVAAFRAQAGTNVGAGASAPASSGNVVPLAQRTALKQWSWVKTFATAATAAAAAILLMIIPPGMDAPADKGDPRASKATTTPRTEENPSVAAVIKTPPPVENFEDEPARTLNPSKSVPTPRVAPASRGEGRMMATTTVGYNTSGGRGSQTPGGADAAARDDEIVTDFIPLSQGGARLSAGDGGQVVRIELPRSALERFGLPMNVERANERVKADVLLGEDGMARAIRFVR